LKVKSCENILPVAPEYFQSCLFSLLQLALLQTTVTVICDWQLTPARSLSFAPLTSADKH
jgi:hypothetical protein